MTSLTVFGIAAVVGLATAITLGEPRSGGPGVVRPAGEPASPPASLPAAQPAGNGWDGQWYRYEPARPMVVEETTPTTDQINFSHRPRQMPARQPAPVSSARPAEPAAVGALNVVRLRFRDADGGDVPCLLCTPRGKKGPFPVVIALHGLGSNKAQVCGQVAGQLGARGFATLAFDLPLHGERPGDPHAFLNSRDLARSFVNARQAVVDARRCIDLAGQRPELDAKGGVVLVGYSMGSILNSLIGPTDERVKAMCLMVGGTPEFPPMAAAVPQLAAMQPQLALPHFAGRPLLMLNGTLDPTITREMGERLFAAAEQPKQQVWFPSGHHLPAEAYEQAAAWVEQTWRMRAPAAKE